MTSKLSPSWLLGARNNLFGQEGGAGDKRGADLTKNERTCHSNLLYFPLNETIIYKMNMLYSRRLVTSYRDIKLIRKLFSEVINQVKGKVIFS